jgi:hypothetical protein
MTYSIFYSTKALQLFLEAFALAAVLMALVFPRLGRETFRRVERWIASTASSPRQAIVTAALLPLFARAILLPALPIPLPRVHDEFSYLLLGDTFAHGRLANPTPPHAEHFETEYELVRPAYASQYQPAQGIALAAGKLVAGNAWFGVWLTTGLMFGVLCWALAGLLTWRWALFGTLLAALQFGIFGFWMNSYFGGSVPAIGGALAFGALTRRFSARTAILCAVGLLILFASRPVEGLLWCVVALAFVCMRMRRSFDGRAVVAFVLVLMSGASLLGLYNARVTGNPARMPYSLYRQSYGTPQSYWWQPAVIVRHFSNPELEANYNDQMRYWERRYSAAAIWDSTWRRLRDFWRFFAGPFLTPALLLGAFALRRRKLRPWIWVSLLFILDHATYHAWYPQQSASETVLVVLFIVEGWRTLRLCARRKGWGLAVSRNLATAFVAASVVLVVGLTAAPSIPVGWSFPQRVLAGLKSTPGGRDLAMAWLERIPGKHLVFVHYGPKHNWYDEWVFNDADLNSSKIVFARMCTPESDASLAAAMPDRVVWIADPSRRFLSRTTIAGLIHSDLARP